MNKPFVAMREFGKIINFPETGKFVSPFPNRRQRRQPMQKFRFLNNSAGSKITVMGKPAVKFKRSVQVIKLAGHSTTRIEHTIMV